MPTSTFQAATVFSECTTVMVVSRINLKSLRGNAMSLKVAWMFSLIVDSLCLGQEVALFVKKHFKNELIKLPSYKSKCYKEALEECFLKMDEIMETKAGKDELAQF